MDIQIHWASTGRSKALDEHINEQVTHGLRHFADRFTRVDVHLHDDNADKGGADDKRIMIEARPMRAAPLIVEGTGDDWYKTASAACKKLERAVRHHFDKMKRH